MSTQSVHQANGGAFFNPNQSKATSVRDCKRALAIEFNAWPLSFGELGKMGKVCALGILEPRGLATSPGNQGRITLRAVCPKNPLKARLESRQHPVPLP